MSEYTPITGELRDAMCKLGWVESDGTITLTSSSTPPSIDADQSLAISGSDFGRHCDAIDDIHAQLERENAALRAELDRVLGEQDNGATMPLPLDMNGEPIHIGDRMKTQSGRVDLVEGILSDRYLVLRNTEWLTCKAQRAHHYQPDTWDSIIYDAMQAGRTDITVDVTPLIERCKKLAGES